METKEKKLFVSKKKKKKRKRERRREKKKTNKLTRLKQRDKEPQKNE